MRPSSSDAAPIRVTRSNAASHSRAARYARQADSAGVVRRHKAKLRTALLEEDPSERVEVETTVALSEQADIQSRGAHRFGQVGTEERDRQFPVEKRRNRECGEALSHVRPQAR